MQSVPVISIIDDDESMREAIQNLIHALGFVAYTFTSAEAFLQSGHVSDTSCLITDVQMPGLSGSDLQKLLIAQGHRLPIIFVTGFPDEEIREQVMRNGAIGFLSKPFDGELLVKHIEAALNRAAPSPPPT